MAKEFNLKITTCDRSFYDGPCESIVLPAIDGEHGVHADHEPMVTAIVSGLHVDLLQMVNKILSP